METIPWEGILVFFQQMGSGIHPISFELADKAKDLAQQTQSEAYGILIGSHLEEAAMEHLINSGLKAIYIYEDDAYRYFTPDAYCAVLSECIERLHPAVVLFGATLEGRSLAPMCAARWKTGVTADCTELKIDTKGNLLQTRPAFGGSIMAEIITKETRPQMATVRYGIMKTAVYQADAPTEIVRCGVTKRSAESAVTVLESLQENGEDDLSNVRIILAAGGGVRRREDLEQFAHLSKLMKAQLMCSRVLVERGWLPPSRQIGLSGHIVSPQLLLTFGISGSVQFMAGVQNAKKIYALADDPAARIFQMADVPMLGDLYEIIPILVQKLSNHRTLHETA